MRSYISKLDQKMSKRISDDKLNSKSKQLVAILAEDFPQFSFLTGHRDHWSPKTQTIFYDIDQTYEQLSFSLLHELSHAVLEHHDYESDFELIKLESEAWHLAQKLGKKYSIEISDDHVQKCLDTYRDWLHRRSSCPDCDTRAMQINLKTYKCFNCGCEWHVASDHFARPYRRKSVLNKN